MNILDAEPPEAPVYGEAWRRWTDPDVPNFLDPTWYLLDRHLDASAGKRALLVDGRAYSYEELTQAVDRAAAGLAELGIRAGQRMLMFGSDSFEYVVFWLAAVRRAAIPVTISDLIPAQQFPYFLEDSDPTVLYLDAAQATKVRSALGVGRRLAHLITRGPADLAPGPGVALHDTSDVTAAATLARSSVERHANDPAYMLYSGSTTGPAKGIVHLTHDFLLIPARQGSFWQYMPDDVVHATSKKYFTHGLWPGVLIPLHVGATSAISSRPPAPAEVVNLIESVRPSKLITVPTVIKQILGWIDQTGYQPDFSSLNLAVTASERMPPTVFERFRALSGVEVMDSIGSSEITYEWIANRPGESRRGSVGKPIFGVEVRLVDADGRDVTKPGDPGEAWVKSSTSLLHYWRKLDKTREAQIGPWTRTGDVLTFDEDGFFWFVGRNDDLFKVKGMWVSPVEVEAAIARHPEVREVAVVGVETDEGLTTPRAFVVLSPESAAGGDLVAAIKSLVAEIGGYKVPDEVVFVEELPRTPLMKIDRRALRRRPPEPTPPGGAG